MNYKLDSSEFDISPSSTGSVGAVCGTDGRSRRSDGSEFRSYNGHFFR